jgi:hypothetical protein
MRRCRNRRVQYMIHLNKFIVRKTYWRNFVETTSLKRAIRMSKKLKLKYRQIDVRQWGKKPYVLHNSWL